VCVSARDVHCHPRSTSPPDHVTSADTVADNAPSCSHSTPGGSTHCAGDVTVVAPATVARRSPPPYDVTVDCSGSHDDQCHVTRTDVAVSCVTSELLANVKQPAVYHSVCLSVCPSVRLHSVF